MKQTHEADGRRRDRVRIARLATAALAASALAAGWWHWPGENFGVVDPGRAYRCAQPGANLDRLLATYRPATVLNLRGGTEAESWYREEVRATRAGKIAFYDLPLSATRRPTRRELAVLIDLLGRCELPLLIHCKSGADRTGLASGLYRMVRQGEPPEQALGAFSLRFGHVPLLGTEHLHEPFAEYAAWLKGQGLPHAPGRLREWVESAYRADDSPAVVPRLQPGPRTRLARGESTRR